MPDREVITGEALQWLGAMPPRPGLSFLTSLPDSSETGTPFERWEPWFVEAAAAIFSRLDGQGLAVLLQTDVRREGLWVDKGALVARAAAMTGAELLFRKAVCRRPPGTPSSGRSALTTLLVYGRGRRPDPALPDIVPDLILDPGEPTWTRGLGEGGVRAAIQLIRRYSPTTTCVVDPFCGEGMVLAVANEAGLDALGVELNRKRAERARALTLRGDPGGTSPTTTRTSG